MNFLKEKSLPYIFIKIFLYFLVFEFSKRIVIILFKLYGKFFIGGNIIPFISENYALINSLESLLGIIILYQFYKRSSSERIKEKIKLSPKNIWKYIIIGFALAEIGFLVQRLILSHFWYLPSVRASYNSFTQITQIIDFYNPYILHFLATVILAPIVEELCFRGLIFNELNKYKAGAFPIIGSALLFALMHGRIIQSAYVLIPGLILGYVYSKTGSLKTTILIHMTNNLLSTLPQSLNTPQIGYYLNIIKLISIIPMIYFLIKLNKKSPEYA